MKIILHGSLKRQFPEFEIGAETVADALEGWSRQCGLADIPLQDRPLVEVLHVDTLEKLTQKTDREEIHLYPAMYGGGGVGKIIIGAILIVGAIFLAPYIGAQLAGAMFMAGLSMVIGGVMQLFMKAPSVDKSDDPDPSKYLGAGGNTTAIGTLIPKGYGRFLIPGQYLSLQVNANDMVYGTFPTTVPA